MPTKVVQEIIDAAIAVATIYATVKTNSRDNPQIVTIDGEGNMDIHVPEGMDASAQLERLLHATLALVEDPQAAGNY